jgi:4-alpha-glucanotransferase
LDDFALFMAIKESHDMRGLDTWEPALKRREPEAINAFRAAHADDIERNRILQYWFYSQLAALRQYVHGKGVSLIGDIPFYVAGDSADVWAHPELFELDDDLTPVSVAGVSPDAFSDDGQLWGNPIYNYAAMRADGYAWWRSRIAQSFVQCDVLRIDHFRAFHSYYTVPYSSPNARNGQWLPGEGMAMLEALALKVSASLRRTWAILAKR